MSINGPAPINVVPDLALAFLPLTSLGSDTNWKWPPPGSLDCLRCPPWQKTTQSRATIRACFFARLSTRPPHCYMQRGRMAIWINLIVNAIEALEGQQVA